MADYGSSATMPAVPIDLSFVAPQGEKPGAWTVVHSDGTLLFSSADEEPARARLAHLRSLAKTRMSAGHKVSGQDMLTLFPPTAPASLVMTALAADELSREDVFDSTSKTWKMRNVEIFRSGAALKKVRGEWKTLTFTADDVHAFVEAFDALGWTPPVKVGHGDDQAIVLEQLPALARVVDVRAAKVRGRDGSDQLGLFADLEKVPEALHAAIREGKLFQRSIEFWTDQIPRPNGGKFSRVLKAVALLGSELPAVGGMPALDVAPAKFAAGETHTVNLTMETHPVPDTPPKDGSGAQVIQLSADEYAKQQQERATLKAETDRQKAELEELKKLTARLSIERSVESATGAASRLRDAGKITPAQEPYVLEILKTLDDDKKDAVVVTLSTEKGTQEKKSSVRAAFLSLLDSFPKHVNAPGAGATKGNKNGGTDVSGAFSALSAEDQTKAVANLGAKYAEEAKATDSKALAAQYERARKDLVAGKVDVATVLA